MDEEPPESGEPEAPESTEGGRPGVTAPRILVSVEDLEDPGDWDVIVVENDAIDNATALRIARQRAGRSGIALPSLDEADIMKAFETDLDAEDPRDLSFDAFSPPELQVPPRRRPARVAPAPLLEDDGFDELALGFNPSPRTTDDEVPRVKPGVVPELAVDDEPEIDPPSGDEVFDRIATSLRPRPAVSPDDLLVDDWEDEDEPTNPLGVLPGVLADSVRISADRVGTEGTPGPTEYDLSAVLEGALEDGGHAPAGGPEEHETGKAPVDIDLWGRGPDGEDRVVPALTSVQLESLPDDLEEEIDEPTEDGLLIDSSFPLGPGDVVGDGSGAAIDVSSLDYASVFGPVQGTLPEPNLGAPTPLARRTATADRIYGPAAVAAGAGEIDDDEDDDDEVGPDLWPVPAARRGPGRRELVTLGIAALMLALIGIATQLIGNSERPSLEASDSTTSSSLGRTRSTSATTSPSVTVAGEVVAPPVEGDELNVGTTVTTARPRNTTTPVTTRPTTTTTPPTTPPPTSTSTTATTAPPTTTTTAPTTTTTLPE